jgi:hypothetical protein
MGEPCNDCPQRSIVDSLKGDFSKIQRDVDDIRVDVKVMKIALLGSLEKPEGMIQRLNAVERTIANLGRYGWVLITALTGALVTIAVKVWGP